MIEQRLGFIGAGQMATALARGFVQAGLTSADRITASDPVAVSRQAFETATGAQAGEDNVAVAENSDVVFLAVKPQYLESAVESVKHALRAEHLVVSIVAGVKLARLSDLLGSGPRLVRVMPNTPCLVGQSASGYALRENTTPADAELMQTLLASVGLAFRLDENLLDAVTGLSGSGPAFVYTIIEALSDGGVRMGLPRQIAAALAAQTVRGAAQMVLETGDHPAVLRDRVASPGGTTIAGLQTLEDRGLRGALMAAVEAATRRSIELGR